MKSELKKAKEKAWKVFSLFIRLKYSNSFGDCRCVTCGTVKHYKEMHAGHFIDGRNNSVLYNEDLVYPQCFHCNSKMPGCLGGNKVSYTIFMQKKGYTLQQIDDFNKLYYTAKPMKEHEHKDIEKMYKNKIKELDKNVMG
jgi:hypothetical protein